ncbi:MAG: LysR family transcriptional regulator [Methylobacteriaceae bacterium]|nr:LysR family transcriptional regulator [Methylobacteriaceae bacterium]
MLDTDQLRSFLAIVDSGSFTRAAERVNKTQSAVSMQIRRLEEQLGRALFMKQGRGVRLSQDGERLVDHAREMLRVEAAALAAISGKALAGRVVLGLPDDYVDWLLADVVQQFLASHPLVELSIVCDHSVRLVDRVAARELDLAVITASGGEVVPHAEPLSRQRLSWIGGARCVPKLRDGAPLPLALDGPTCCWRRAAVAALDEAGMKYRFVVLSRSLSAIAPIVQAGLALTVLPAGALNGDMRIVDAELDLPELPWAEIGLIMRPGAASRESQALADVIRRVTRAARGEAVAGPAQRVAAE